MNIKTDCPSGPQGSLGVVMVPSGWIWPEGVRHGPICFLYGRYSMRAFNRYFANNWQFTGLYGHYAVGVYFIIITPHHSHSSLLVIMNDHDDDWPLRAV